MASIRDSVQRQKQGGFGASIAQAIGSVLRGTGRALDKGFIAGARATGKFAGLVKEKVSSIDFGAVIRFIVVGVLKLRDLIKATIMKLYDLIIGETEKAKKSETAKLLRQKKDEFKAYMDSGDIQYKASKYNILTSEGRSNIFEKVKEKAAVFQGHIKQGMEDYENIRSQQESEQTESHEEERLPEKKAGRLRRFFLGEEGIARYNAKQIAKEEAKKAKEQAKAEKRALREAAKKDKQAAREEAKKKEREDFLKSLNKEAEQASERREEIDQEKESSNKKLSEKIKEHHKKSGVWGVVTGLLSGIAGTLGKILGAVSTVGSALLNMAGLGGVLKAGKTIWNIGKGLFRAARFVAGPAAKALMWGARLAFLNPVGLTATAIAGGAFLAYKGYKWLTRNDTNNVQKLRMMYYGLSDLDDKNSKSRAHVSTLYNLEDIALDHIKITESGDILTRQIDEPNKVYTLFNIDTTKEEVVRDFDQWYTKRFIPVLTEFIKAGYLLTRKLDVRECLKIEDKDFKYLTDNLRVEQSVHLINYMYLNGVKVPIHITQTIINDFVARTNKDIDKKTKEAIESKVKDKKALDVTVNSSSPNLVKQHMNPLGALKNKGKTETVDPEKEREPKNISINPIADKTVQSISEGMVVRDGALQVAENKDVREYIQPGSTTFKKIESLNPTFLKYLISMAKEYYQITGKKLVVDSAFRTEEEQRELAAKNPNAAKGLSMHNFGLAVDIPSAITTELDKLGLLRKYGFTKPVGQEKWHVESIGVSMNFDKVKQTPNIADELIEKSIGRGGGGWADVAHAAELSRNVEYLRKIYEAPSVPASSDKDNGIVVSKASDIYKDNTNTSSTQASAPAESSQDTTIRKASDIFKEASSTPVKTAAVAASGTSGVPISDAESIPKTVVSSSGNTAISSKNYAASQPVNVSEAIQKAAEATGVDKDYLVKAAYRESRFDASARNSTSTAAGLFQFTNDTWHRSISAFGRKYGLDHRNADINNPEHNALMAAELALDNYNRIKEIANKAGISPKVAMYLAHHFGSGDSRVYLKNYMLDPNRYIANSELGGLIKSNKHLQSETFGSFLAKLESEFGGGSAPMMTASMSKPTPPSVTQEAKTDTSTPAISPVTSPSVAVAKPTTTVPNIAGISTPSPVRQETPAVSAASPVVDMKNLENIASQQLSVLNQIRDLLKENLSSRSLPQEPTQPSNPFIKAGSEPIKIPEKKVSMGVL